jgi:hypothetical protein
VAIDLFYGPLYHRLLHGHAPLDDQFVDDLVDMGLRGILPPARAGQQRCSLGMPRVRGWSRRGGGGRGRVRAG